MSFEIRLGRVGGRPVGEPVYGRRGSVGGRQVLRKLLARRVPSVLAPELLLLVVHLLVLVLVVRVHDGHDRAVHPVQVLFDVGGRADVLPSSRNR